VGAEADRLLAIDVPPNLLALADEVIEQWHCVRFWRKAEVPGAAA
jgi:hypothetical protein